MTNTQKHLLTALIACLAPVAGMAGNIGEPAPPLAVKAWIKDKPWQFKVGTNYFAAGTNIYIIEIFATSSLASRACITNLNAVQKGFKDKGVVVVGLSEEPVETLKQFVQRDGAMIEYAIAADIERRTVLSLMTPARQKGLPCAFVVGKDGKLLWYGHPMRGLKELLDAVIAGNYDGQWGRKVEAAQRQMVQYLTFARQKDARTKPAGLIVLAARTNDVGLLCDMA
ncbi:MAG: redoxin domain-containing protein, partial [Verrucomicrobiota bacterium]